MAVTVATNSQPSDRQHHSHINTHCGCPTSSSVRRGLYHGG
ncbi:hypothetical protein [Moraxella lacunata]